MNQTKEKCPGTAATVQSTSTNKQFNYTRDSLICKANFKMTAPDNSMSGARIIKGDTVLLDSELPIENGNVALVAVDGKRLLRKVSYLPDGSIQLSSTNAESCIYYPGDAVVRCLARAVAVCVGVQ